LALVVVPVAVFAYVTSLVVRDASQLWDERVISGIQDEGNSVLRRVMLFITDTGGVGRAVPIAIVLALFLWKRLHRDAVTLVAAAVGAQLITQTFKSLVGRARPPLDIQIGRFPTDPSYPSGHALGSTVLYGFLAVWLWRRGHRIAAVIAGIWAALVSFSRVYLGSHHPTDVMGSLCLGVAWLTTVFLVYDEFVRRKHATRPLEQAAL